MMPPNDRSRPAKAAPNVTSGDDSRVRDATDFDPFCCGRLGFDDLATCIRFRITCGDGRCAFDVLGAPK
jgi:hypothetical protein